MKRFFVVGVIFIFAINLCFAMEVDGKEVKIIAHKGGKYWEGSNFLYVNDSISLGADVIELDVQHRLFRGYIVQHPFGFPGFDRDVFFPYQGKLKDALKVISNRAWVYLDVKDNSISPKRLIKFVRKYHNNTIIVGSFNWNYLRKFNGLDDDLIINLHTLPFVYAINNGKNIGADWINPYPFYLTEDYANKIQEEGFEFVPCGIENYTKLKQFIDWGAYAVSVYDIEKFKDSVNSTN